jgi:hypothetical protein
MSRTRMLLAAASLAGVLFSGLGTGAASASAQEGPAEQSPRASNPSDPSGPSARSSRDVQVVHDPGLDSSPRTDSARNLAACYDGEKPWDAGLRDPDGDSHYIPGRDDAPDSAVGRVPVYVASSRCNDVNLRVTGGWVPNLAARVCFFPSSRAYYCNQWTPIAVGDAGWHVIARSVLDGTRFEVELRSPGDHPTGFIAY